MLKCKYVSRTSSVLTVAQIDHGKWQSGVQHYWSVSGNSWAQQFDPLMGLRLCSSAAPDKCCDFTSNLSDWCFQHHHHQTSIIMVATGTIVTQDEEDPISHADIIWAFCLSRWGIATCAPPPLDALVVVSLLVGSSTPQYILTSLAQSQNLPQIHIDI
jgi:hypothetical protein